MPLVLEEGLVERIKASMPELPDAKRKRFIEEYKLSDYDADILTSEREIAEYFEEAIGKDKVRDGKMIANWMQTELFAVLNKEGKDIKESPIPASSLGELVDLIKDGTISGKIAKDVFKFMYEGDEKSPRKIVEAKDLKQVSDTSAIEKVIDEIIASSPDNVNAYKGGKVQLFGWFVGQTLKAMKGQANPQIVNQILKQKLG